MNSTKNKFQSQNLESQGQLYQQQRQQQQKDKKANDGKQNKNDNIKHGNIQTTQLTESKINTLYKILTLNKESKKQSKNNKLQEIFQIICNLDMNQKKVNSQIVQNFVKYTKESIKNGQVMLLNVKYRKYFQSYIYGHIRQPYPNQLLVLQQKQGKQEKVNVQIHTQEKQHVPEIQQKKQNINTRKLQEIIIKIQRQLTKQANRSPNFKQILKQLFVLFEQVQNSNEKKQLTQIFIHVWKLFSNSNNNSYFRQLLCKILTLSDTNKQLSQDIIIQGWLCDPSRNYITQMIIEWFQCKNQNSNINASLLCSIIDKKICEKNSSEINNALNDWHFFKQLYLNVSIQYSQYQIKQFMRTYSNERYAQIQRFANHLSPEQIVLLSKQIKLHEQYTNIIEQMNKNDSQKSNINYLHYLLQNNTEDSNHLKMYIQKQQQIIKEQVINNSYPTQELISNSFISLTNIIYQLNQNNFNQENLSHRALTTKIIKQFHKSLQELYSNLSTTRSNILNQQRLQLYYGFVVQQLPVLCEKFIIFFVNQISNPSASICGLYNMLKICNYILSNEANNKQDPTLPLPAIQNLNSIIISNSTNAQKQTQIRLICIQLLKYITSIPIQHLKTSTQKYKQIIIFLQKTLYNTNKNQNILYSNKLIQIILLSSQKFNFISELGQSYLLQFINRKQEADKLMIGFNQQEEKSNRNLMTVASSALQLSLSLSRLKGLDTKNNTEKIPTIIDELIIRKSQTITQCMNLLIRQQDEIDKLSKFLSFVGYGQQKIYNLHQYDNVAIKYCQIIEHNTESRQPVFYSDMYRNHSNMYIYFQTFKLYLNTLQKLENPPKKISQIISSHIIQSIKYIKVRQSKVIHNSAQFYHLLNRWKLIYCASYYQDIVHLLIFDFNSLVQFNMDNCCWILGEILEIFQLGNIHPLIRQYASLTLSLLYTSIDQYNTSNQQHIKIKKLIKKRWRGQLLQKLNPKNNVVNINVFVPIIFTLGYEMINNTKIMHQRYQQNYSQKINEQKQYGEVVDTLIRYISCHHAYIRSLAQYYIMKKIQIQKQCQSKNNKIIEKQQLFIKKDEQNSLVEYLCEHVWKKDRDCIKIMRNVGIGVQGFREAMENAQSIQFLGYERVQQYPNEIVLYQFRLDYYRVLQQFYRFNQKQLEKSRLKLFKQGQILFDESSNQEINYLSTFSKMLKHKLQKLHSYLQHPQIPLILQYRRPQIIIIASLLEKVHNFGYILRTLHEKRAMLLIPSKQLIQNPQCQQFIPKNSQIQVIEIKQNQLDSFIKLNKKIGYPLIGLEQCAGSVKIQQYQFPNQYMLLLGNEKIGAPASLLNQADVLVEIPQVGKVRSLNVHVSMVICLWQSIIKNTDNIQIK